MSTREEQGIKTYLQKRFGKNWDTRPHGSDPNSGDKCECDKCCEWADNYRKYEEQAAPTGEYVNQRSSDGVVSVQTHFVHALDGDALLITQNLYDQRRGIEPYTTNTVTLQKHELESMMPTINKILEKRR